MARRAAVNSSRATQGVPGVFPDIAFDQALIDEKKKSMPVATPHAPLSDDGFRTRSPLAVMMTGASSGICSSSMSMLDRKRGDGGLPASNRWLNSSGRHGFLLGAAGSWCAFAPWAERLSWFFFFFFPRHGLPCSRVRASLDHFFPPLGCSPGAYPCIMDEAFPGLSIKGWS